MQISVEKLEGLTRKVNVQVPYETLNDAYLAKVKEVSKTVRMNGFRAGKVPPKIVEQKYGKGIRQEIIGEIIQTKLGEAIDQENLQPAGMPQIDSIVDEKDKPFEFSAIFEEMPEIKLADFSEVSVEKFDAAIEDKDLDDMIETLRKQRSTEKERKRKTKKGDVVVIDFKGLKDGEPFEGGTAEGQRLELGSGQMVPGFEEGIIGMKPGEELTIDVTFPEDYQSEELKGQAVQFEIKMTQMFEKVLPEVDADFMKELGVETDNVEEFKAEIRKNMERELKMRLLARQKEAVIASLVEANEFDIPEALVKQEIQRQKQQMMQQFGQQQAQFSLDSIPDDIFKDKSEQQVRAGLVLRQIMEDHKLIVDGKKVRAYIEDVASAYDDSEEVINHYYENDNLLQQVEGIVLENQMVDLVMDKAKVEAKTLTYQEAVTPQQ